MVASKQVVQLIKKLDQVTRKRKGPLNYTIDSQGRVAYTNGEVLLMHQYFDASKVEYRTIAGNLVKPEDRTLQIDEVRMIALFNRHLSDNNYPVLTFDPSFYKALNPFNTTAKAKSYGVFGLEYFEAWENLSLDGPAKGHTVESVSFKWWYNDDGSPRPESPTHIGINLAYLKASKAEKVRMADENLPFIFTKPQIKGLEEYTLLTMAVKNPPRI